MRFKMKRRNQMKIRHGDVVIELVKEMPSDVKLLKGRRELAYGEVTGHAHRVNIVDCLFETKKGQLYLKVDKLAKVSHEEHKTVTLNPGVYKVTIKRQDNAKNGWEAVSD
jgi:hypothetical protein